MALRRGTVSDARAHGNLLRADLAFKDLISYHHLPVALEDGGMELQAWPMILPESMVGPLYTVFSIAAWHVDVFSISFCKFPRSNASYKWGIVRFWARPRMSTGKSCPASSVSIGLMMCQTAYLSAYSVMRWRSLMETNTCASIGLRKFRSTTPMPNCRSFYAS